MHPISTFPPATHWNKRIIKSMQKEFWDAAGEGISGATLLSGPLDLPLRKDGKHEQASFYRALKISRRYFTA